VFWHQQDEGYRNVPEPDRDPTLQVLEWQMPSARGLVSGHLAGQTGESQSFMRKQRRHFFFLCEFGS
jgi:hypothetical protein